MPLAGEIGELRKLSSLEIYSQGEGVIRKEFEEAIAKKPGA
jgi:hypothetical protein